MDDITVTERAARRIGEILRREPLGTMLRLSVEGGGCSGFQYKFDTDSAREADDVVVRRADARNRSMPKRCSALLPSILEMPRCLKSILSPLRKTAKRSTN